MQRSRTAAPMGNWSCLYHWFECPSHLVAREIYARLEHAAEHAWDDDTWALRFGFISPTLVQAASLQRWGLEPELADWAMRGYDSVTLTQAGMDREELYRVRGTPAAFSCRWNYLLCLDGPPSLPARLVEASQWRLHLETAAGWPILRADRSYAVTPRFFSGRHSGPHSPLLRRLIHCALATTSEPVRLLLGNASPEHGHVHVGLLTLNSLLSSVSFETTGAFNRLVGEVLLGPCREPIDGPEEQILLDDRTIDLDLGAALSPRAALCAADPVIRHAALERIRQSNAPLPPEVFAAIADPSAEVRAAAARCLRPGRQTAVFASEPPEGWQAFLHECLGSTSWQVRLMAAERLGELGDASSLALLERMVEPGPIHGAADSFWEVRRAALRAIAAIVARCQLAPEPVLHLASQALHDQHQHVRITALTTLEALHPASVAMEPVLLHALADPAEPVRSLAAELLSRHGGHSAAAVGALLGQQRPDVRIAAARALGLMGPAAAPALPALCHALTHQDFRTREAAALAIQAMGSAAASAVPALAAAVAAEPAVEHLHALAAIATDAATHALTEHLDHRDPDTSATAALALARLGPRAASAAARLTANLSHPHHAVRTSALDALVAIGLPDGVDVTPLLADQHSSVRAAALRALLASRGWTEPVLARLSAALDDDSPRVAVTAAELLAGRGIAVLPIMHAGLGSRHDAAVVVLARAFMRLGPAAEDALMGLLRNLGHESYAVREACADAMGALGPAARSALPRLRHLAVIEHIWQAAFAAGRLHPVSDMAALRALIAGPQPAAERIAAALACGLIDPWSLHDVALSCASRTVRLMATAVGHEPQAARLLEPKRRWLHSHDAGPDPAGDPARWRAMRDAHQRAVGLARQREESWSHNQGDALEILELACALAIAAATAPDCMEAALGASHAALAAAHEAEDIEPLGRPEAGSDEAAAQLADIRQQIA